MGLYIIYKEIINCGFPASSYLDFGILRFGIDIWRFIHTFRINTIA